MMIIIENQYIIVKIKKKSFESFSSEIKCLPLEVFNCLFTMPSNHFCVFIPNRINTKRLHKVRVIFPAFHINDLKQ